MFDIAFSELVIIAIVALLVIGPEKLPKVARTLGALVGRMQRYVAQVKEEVNREGRFAELQQLQQEIKNTTNVTKTHLENYSDQLVQEVTQVASQEVQQDGVPPAQNQQPNKEIK